MKLCETFNLTTLVCLFLATTFCVTCRAQSAAQPASEPYKWQNVEIGGGGGFVDGIVFSTKQPDLIYARTDIGGAYRWDQRAKRWIPLNDWVGQADGNLRGAESIALDPTDANRVYIMAGTYNRQAAAILRSTDQGRTWLKTDVPFFMGGNEDGRSIGERLAVDPNNPSTIYCGTRHDGLWKSTDYGATFAKVDTFPAVPDNPAPGGSGGFFAFRSSRSAGVGFVVFDPRSGSPGSPTKTIYVGVAVASTVTATQFSPLGGPATVTNEPVPVPVQTLYRSTDAGATWQPVPGQPTGLLPHHAVLTTDGVLYLTYSNGIGPNGITDGAVYKLSTSDGTWTDITPVKPDPKTTPGGYAGLTIDPRHPQTVMVSTLDYWHPGDEVYRSLDGGAHWIAISPHAVMDPTGAPWLKWGKPTPRFGWWMGTLETDPFHPNRVMYGTGATIWGTDRIQDADSGKPTHWKMYAEGIEETAVTALISPSDGAHLVSGLGDIGGFTHDNLDVSPPSGMASPIFTTTNSLDFAELAPRTIVRVGSPQDNGPSGAYSVDGGETWTPFASTPSGSRGGGAIAISADGKSIVWTTGASPYYSHDNGATWTASTGLPAPPAPAPGAGFARFFRGPRVAVVSDRVNPSVFYAYDPGAGILYASADSAASFAQKSTGLPQRGMLHATPGREGDLWLTAGASGLYHSVDGGVTFSPVSSAPNLDGLGFGKPAPGSSYPALFITGTISGFHGVYRSDDEAKSWIRINDDAHQYGWIGGPQPIIGDPRIFGRVYLGTNGRGILYGDPIRTK